jgi:hypothetical protein
MRRGEERCAEEQSKVKCRYTKQTSLSQEDVCDLIEKRDIQYIFTPDLTSQWTT